MAKKKRKYTLRAGEEVVGEMPRKKRETAKNLQYSITALQETLRITLIAKDRRIREALRDVEALQYVRVQQETEIREMKLQIAYNSVDRLGQPMAAEKRGDA